MKSADSGEVQCGSAEHFPDKNGTAWGLEGMHEHETDITAIEKFPRALERPQLRTVHTELQNLRMCDTLVCNVTASPAHSRRELRKS